MRSILTLIVTAATAVMILQSCGGSKTAEQAAGPAPTETQKSQLAEALSSGNLRQASAMADSMSLFVDDFTPEQTVQVLSTFVKVHTEAEARHETRRNLETLRKFVDVYDIALSVNPKDTRAAFEKARRSNPALDFDSLAAAFREKLSNYDSMQDGSLVSSNDTPADSASARADTIKPTPEPKEIPLEHRPAE